MGNLTPPPPSPHPNEIKDRKWRDLLFHFILYKIVDSLLPEGCLAARID